MGLLAEIYIPRAASLSFRVHPRNLKISLEISLYARDDKIAGKY